MAELHQVYKCGVCGNIVEVVHAGEGVNLVCCGQAMVLMKENSIDASKEKHVPVVEKGATLKVKVGSVPHPMEDKHYIEWIEVIADGRSYKKFLKAGDKPEAEFNVKADDAIVRAYCNIHGLWKA
jgi:superoxide reductase